MRPETWKLKATGEIFEFVAIGNYTPTNELVVVYRHRETKALLVMPSREFYSGRFVRVLEQKA